jgi:hypothetical protein
VVEALRASVTTAPLTGDAAPGVYAVQNATTKGVATGTADPVRALVRTTVDRVVLRIRAAEIILRKSQTNDSGVARMKGREFFACRCRNDGSPAARRS